MLSTPGRPLEPITLEERFAPSCCKLGCATLRCTPPIAYITAVHRETHLRLGTTHCAADSCCVLLTPQEEKKCVCVWLQEKASFVSCRKSKPPEQWTHSTRRQTRHTHTAHKALLMTPDYTRKGPRDEREARSTNGMKKNSIKMIKRGEKTVQGFTQSSS